MIGDAVRLGETARFGGRELARVFVIGAVVDDRAHAGCGERVDIAGPERASGAQPGSKLGERRKRGHAAAPAISPPRLAGRRRLVT